MIKHSKIKTLKSTKKIERNKTIFHSFFKSSLFVLACTTLVFTFIIIGFIIVRGIQGAIKIPHLFDGGTFDGQTMFASGFMVVNTLWTTFLAILIAVPISTLTALFITRVAPKMLKPFFFIVLSILAAIPSVIYGAFGSKLLDWLIMIIFGTSSGTLLTIVITLSFMIMPTITLITTASINSVDRKMEDSSLALGATRNQTSYYITLRAASTGILTAVILGVGRAIGEATAVSMITLDPYGGPTFGLLEQIRLLTSTMLKGYNEMDPGSIQMESMFAMGMLLILTILIVFVGMRFVQKMISSDNKSKKAAKKIQSKKTILNLVDEYGFENSPVKVQNKYIKFKENQREEELIENYYHIKSKKNLIINKTTIKTTNILEKERKSKILGLITYLMAMVGVVFLVSIILFLLVQGSTSLSWKYITTQGSFIDPKNGLKINGLQSSIFGTLLLIGLSMLLIIPLGIGTGIYFSMFAKKTRFTKILTMGIDILAGIPSLVFGLIGAAMFLPLASVIKFAPLAGALILTLIIIPTVSQTTQEAINSVSQKTISASLALGSTKTVSAIKIALPEALPQIISGVILAIGRIIGESAAIVMLFGTINRGSSSEWMHFGGTTLATEIYRLTLLEIIPWDLVCAIGLVIISIILILSLLSNYIAHKNTIGVIGVLISLIFVFLGILIKTIILFYIGIAIFIGIIIMCIILRKKKGL